MNLSGANLSMTPYAVRRRRRRIHRALRFLASFLALGAVLAVFVGYWVATP